MWTYYCDMGSGILCSLVTKEHVNNFHTRIPHIRRNRTEEAYGKRITGGGS